MLATAARSAVRAVRHMSTGQAHNQKWSELVKESMKVKFNPQPAKAEASRCAKTEMSNWQNKVRLAQKIQITQYAAGGQTQARVTVKGMKPAAATARLWGGRGGETNGVLPTEFFRSKIWRRGAAASPPHARHPPRICDAEHPARRGWGEGAAWGLVCQRLLNKRQQTLPADIRALCASQGWGGRQGCGRVRGLVPG
eukprot:CAMPEP_0206251460 /NCGR_PEP_ID=MMETSP0047_2-20121206/22038_1 /ASSEMBLY_ACC=CAM_ASM_000192 /TAXON_ID=195065 /ORGANISM="Chroomonas mesostigmatica_cf, Strain CCMP1168" /LENGTH=196 /DNA_ID=CAMNT_0053677419 /DNA_START=49 /DNA_END=640 /DNA_ORIENTATION=-